MYNKLVSAYKQLTTSHEGE